MTLPLEPNEFMKCNTHVFKSKESSEEKLYYGNPPKYKFNPADGT